MTDDDPDDSGPGAAWTTRRALLKGAAAGAALLGGGGTLAAIDGPTGIGLGDALGDLLQDHYLRMTPAEIQGALARIERQARRRFGVTLDCRNDPPLADVRFGFALNLSKCKGTRRCVSACVSENNCGRGGTLQNIRVLELPVGSRDLQDGNPYFTHQTVPVAGHWYVPVQCQQCADPPCVQACPVAATWREPDGIVVIDYDWCIGCRYCATACPYGARHFNWGAPRLSPSDLTRQTHYLGNQPREAGVMEKCTFCLQRTRRGLLPACLEACPTGARIFGNLLDPESEIRQVLARRPVFRLKEEQGTEPRFWFFTDGP
ncbi:MAG: 4Fe-4S dicluster domain-containing protein [Magnetococcales bacterium]|nr:4Fe-4S dicluster domain-containing protein [Magnetococcales bacterium]